LLGDELESRLRDLITELLPPERRGGPGRPPHLSLLVLWAGLLTCVLRGFTAQRALWQLVTLQGLWHFERVALTEQAVVQRLARTRPQAFLDFFAALTRVLRERYAAVNDVPFARFATQILALDHSTLDQVLRKTKVLRQLPAGAPALLPGQLATLFDVRRQLFVRVEFWENAQQNEKHRLTHWLDHLEVGSLLLFDLGFFSFEWFDRLEEAGCYFVSKLRQKTSFVVQHVLFDGVAGPVHLRDQLVYLGKHRADRAAQVVRLLEVTAGKVTYRYLTNVLDPAMLPAAHALELYRRRWDIEQAFNLLKTHLKLFLLWSAHPPTVQHQVFATLCVAQVVLGLRLEIAQRARADLREVSLPLMLRWLPYLAAGDQDPVQLLAERGRAAGLIRAFRGRERLLPEVDLSAYQLPAARPPPRTARYAGKQGKARPADPSKSAQSLKKWKRNARLTCIRRRKSGAR
jgi:hypothetical protein